MHRAARAFSAGLSGHVPGLSLATCRSVHDRSTRVLAAANTAASWARARRSTWNDTPPATVHVAEAEAPTVVLPFQPSSPIDKTRRDVRPTARVPLENSRRAAVAEEAAGQDQATGSWLKRWLLPSGSVAGIVLALGGTACAYFLRPPQPAPARPASTNAERARAHNAGRQQSTVAPRKTTGMMFVASDPVGAR